MKFSLPTVMLLTGVAAALFVLCAVLYYPNLQRIAEHARWVAHTQGVIATLNRVSAALHDAQGEQRTELIVDTRPQPARYTAAIALARSKLAVVARLTADKAVQQARVATLSALIDDVVASWDETLAIRARDGFAAARTRVASGANDRRLARIDAELTDMRELEQALLAARELAARHAYDLAVRTGVALTAVGVLAIVLFGWTLARHLRARDAAADALFHQGQLLQATLNSIGDGVIATDASGKVTFLNDIARQLTGWATDDALGRGLPEVFCIVNEDTRTAAPNPALLALERGAIVGLSNHTILLGRDGSEWPLDDSAAPIRDRAGTVNGAVLVFREISERRRRERALQRSEQQFHTLAESIPQLCWISDAQGDISWFNQVWYDYTGSPPAPMRAQQWAALHHPAHVARVLQHFLAQIAAGEPWEDTFPLCRHDGEYRWFLARAVPLYDAEGGATRWFATCTDITDKRAAEDAVRASEAQLRTVLDNLPVYVGVLDLDGTLREVNRPALDIAGLQRQDAVGLPFTETFWWLRSPTIHDAVRDAIERGRAGLASRFDVVISTADGHTVHADFMLNPVRDAAGRVTQLIPSAVDISERKTIEAALRRQTAKINRLLEAEVLGIIVARDDKVVEANGAFLAMLGYTREDLEQGRLRWPRLTPVEHAASDQRALDDLAAHGRFAAYRKELFHRDGHRVPVLTGGALLDAFEQGWICHVQDLTHVTRVEQQLREADLRKDEFLATLAHELRNPLAPLANSVNLLRLGAPSAQTTQHALETMARQVDQLTRLVDDLMDISRISRGAIELRKQAVALTTVIDSAVETSRPHVALMGHQLEVLMPATSVTLDADTTRLAQVFSNLLNNACKYTNAGGHIRLAATLEDDEVEITVSDDGIGIRADLLPSIFELFAQADRALDRAQGGLGVGLTLVRRLVEMHGGSVRAESGGEGLGARFVVRLPTSTASPRPQPTPGKPAALARARQALRILVVDDNQDNAESLALLLEMLGHEVGVAGDGGQALVAALAQPPDVVLLDIGLPGTDGNEVCRRLRANFGATMTIIAQTGWGQREDRARTRAAGFDYHLVKPIELDALRAILERLPATAT